MDEQQQRALSYGRVAADLIEVVARTTASMSPAERALRLDPVLMRAALRPPLVSVKVVSVEKVGI